MLLFLASVLEQLDLALEHIAKRDIHNARFGLMLTDNALELVLHQIAKEKQSELKIFGHAAEGYEHQKALDKAMLGSFEDKVRFARVTALLSLEESQTINIMHDFRNELYHIGLSREPILPILSTFYFFTACEIIERFRPRSLYWSSVQRIPERAQKYLTGHSTFQGEISQFTAACSLLAQGCGHNDAQLIAILADQLDQIIDQQNSCIDIVAGGVFEGQQQSRNRAVMECQAWPLAFSEEGKSFALQRSWTGSVLTLVDYLIDNYPFKFRGDPIHAWERQTKNFRSKRNGHAALAHYNSFIIETADLRSAIEEAAGAAEAEIDAAIDRARGK